MTSAISPMRQRLNKLARTKLELEKLLKCINAGDEVLSKGEFNERLREIKDYELKESELNPYIAMESEEYHNLDKVYTSLESYLGSATHVGGEQKRTTKWQKHYQEVLSNILRGESFDK